MEEKERSERRQQLVEVDMDNEVAADVAVAVVVDVGVEVVAFVVVANTFVGHKSRDCSQVVILQSAMEYLFEVVVAAVPDVVVVIQSLASQCILK